MVDQIGIALPEMLRTTTEAGPAQVAYEQAVEAFFGSGRAFAFWKGRIALYAILKSLGIGPGDEVVIPGYTCVMVPGPVIYTGARPVYADIEPDGYGVRPDEVARKITPRTRAILVQHTYGLPGAVKEIRQIADQRGIALIEDCCHTFGGRLDGQLLGTFGNAAFFSSQWNKPFSTGLGGLALVHDQELARRMKAEQARCPAPSHKAAFLLAVQLRLHQAVVYPSTSAAVTRLFRWMTKKGLVIGSSNQSEFGVLLPRYYALGPAPLQCRVGRRQVARIQANIANRLRITAQYFGELPKFGYAVPKRSADAEVPILRFPLRVANKDEALARAPRYGVEIGSWFECPLHPAETNHAAFGYQDGDCPEAEKAAREVINLPTHQRVSERDVRRTLAFIRVVCRPAH